MLAVDADVDADVVVVALSTFTRGDIVMRAWPGSWCGKAGLIQSMM